MLEHFLLHFGESFWTLCITNSKFTPTKRELDSENFCVMIVLPQPQGCTDTPTIK